jgi:hypothetical protein
MTNEMHNSYNKFYSSTLSALHVSNESNPSSGAQYNVLCNALHYFVCGIKLIIIIAHLVGH